jgi:hypothetical protein
LARQSEIRVNMSDALLDLLVPVLAEVPGVVGVVLGGSRARGTAGPSSDYDIGLYYNLSRPLDTNHLLNAVRAVVDDPRNITVTAVGDWGPRIVGGAWLSVGGRKVDLLYRCIDSVEQVISDCRGGRIAMDYQPGHPHGFCSAAWMGEVALCQILHDPLAAVAVLKSSTSPYPDRLRDALVRMFQWEILFSIQNAEVAVSRREQTHIAGCAYRALCCSSQVLFAINKRYLINEKGALLEAALFPKTIEQLRERVARVWRDIGDREFGEALANLKSRDDALTKLVQGSD